MKSNKTFIARIPPSQGGFTNSPASTGEFSACGQYFAQLDGPRCILWRLSQEEEGGSSNFTHTTNTLSPRTALSSRRNDSISLHQHDFVATDADTSKQASCVSYTHHPPSWYSVVWQTQLLNDLPVCVHFVHPEKTAFSEASHPPRLHQEEEEEELSLRRDAAVYMLIGLSSGGVLCYDCMEEKVVFQTNGVDSVREWSSSNSLSTPSTTATHHFAPSSPPKNPPIGMSIASSLWRRCFYVSISSSSQPVALTEESRGFSASSKVFIFSLDDGRYLDEISLPSKIVPPSCVCELHLTPGGSRLIVGMLSSSKSAGVVIDLMTKTIVFSLCGAPEAVCRLMVIPARSPPHSVEESTEDGGTMKSGGGDGGLLSPRGVATTMCGCGVWVVGAFSSSPGLMLWCVPDEAQEASIHSMHEEVVGSSKKASSRGGFAGEDESVGKRTFEDLQKASKKKRKLHPVAHLICDECVVKATCIFSRGVGSDERGVSEGGKAGPEGGSSFSASEKDPHSPPPPSSSSLCLMVLGLTASSQMVFWVLSDSQMMNALLGLSSAASASKKKKSAAEAVGGDVLTESQRFATIPMSCRLTPPAADCTYISSEGSPKKEEAKDVATSKPPYGGSSLKQQTMAADRSCWLSFVSLSTPNPAAFSRSSASRSAYIEPSRGVLSSEDAYPPHRSFKCRLLLLVSSLGQMAGFATLSLDHWDLLSMLLKKKKKKLRRIFIAPSQSFSRDSALQKGASSVLDASNPERLSSKTHTHQHQRTSSTDAAPKGPPPHQPTTLPGEKKKDGGLVYSLASISAAKTSIDSVQATPQQEAEANSSLRQPTSTKETLLSSISSLKNHPSSNTATSASGSTTDTHPTREENPPTDDKSGSLVEASKKRSTPSSTHTTTSQHAHTLAPTSNPLLKRGGGGGAAHSMMPMLQQALKTEDKDLLESVLSVGDPSVISHTVRELSSPMALQVLALIVDRMQAVAIRVLFLARWVQEIIKRHSLFLMSSPTAKLILNQLYHHIIKRIETNQSLLRLQGRVDTLMLQAEARSVKRSLVSREVSKAKDPLVEYNEE